MLVLNRWTNREKDSVRTRQVGDESRRFRTFTIITVGGGTSRVRYLQENIRDLQPV